MYPSQHLILGTLFSLGLFIIFPQVGLFGFVVIILATFFIDVDHYLWYVYKKRDINLRNAYYWYIQKEKTREHMPHSEYRKYKHEIMIFHGIEFWTVLALLAVYYNFFLYVFIGIMFHIFLDIAALTYNGRSFSCILCQTYNLSYNRNKKDLL